MDFIIRRIFPHNTNDMKIIRKVGDSLLFLRSEYPDFKDWYNRILKLADREIYIATPCDQEDCIAGIMILKNSPMQKKICTLCVMERYRGMKIGTQFIELACKRLETQVPLITVSQGHQPQFEGLFRKFGFQLFESYPNYYRNNVIEYSYNAEIEPYAAKMVVNG